jgi:hypothetical protein
MPGRFSISPAEAVLILMRSVLSCCSIVLTVNCEEMLEFDGLGSFAHEQSAARELARSNDTMRSIVLTKYNRDEVIQRACELYRSRYCICGSLFVSCMQINACKELRRAPLRCAIC